MKYPELRYFSPTKLKKSGANYQLWKVQMVYRIHRQGLLGFINGTHLPPSETIISLSDEEEDGKTTMINPDYHIWRRTDMLLKQGILSQLDYEIENMASRTSRDLWLELERKFHDPSTDTTPKVVVTHNQRNIVGVRKHKECSSLYKAAIDGDWTETERFIYIERSISTNTQAIALHIAVSSGEKSVRFVDRLVRQMNDESIIAKDEIGDTALSIAAAVGNKEAALILVNRMPTLLYESNNLGIFPVHVAALHAQEDVLEYLIVVTRDDQSQNPYAGVLGLTLLVYVIEAGFFDIALDLVKKFSYLARLKHSSISALETVVAKAPEFVFNIQSYDLAEYFASFTFLIDKEALLSWMSFRITSIELGRKGRKVITLIKKLCEAMKSLNIDEAENIYRDAILTAARLDIHEIVEEIVKAFPNAIYCSDPTTFKTIFHVVVENRSEDTFNLIFKMSDKHKQLYFDLPDIDGNNILHSTAKLAPSYKLKGMNAAFLLTCEVLWFKEVKKLVHPHSKSRLNHIGKTPNMIFNDEHESLRQQAENWMNSANNSYIVAATLICSVMFSASITVPGGNDGTTGMPIFRDFQLYMSFRDANILSLLSSLMSLLLFLSCSSLPYSSEAYYLVLPFLQAFGLGALIISVVSMLVSFLSSMYLYEPNSTDSFSSVFWIPFLVCVCVFLPLLPLALNNYRLPRFLHVKR